MKRNSKLRYKSLSIAGFDGSGGAGIQADLKTFSAFGCYGMTVLTALPVQNTQGVHSCYEIPLKAIEEQLDLIFRDIKPDSIKIGMLFTKPIVELVADFLKRNAEDIPIVLDPVLTAKSGDSLLDSNAMESLKTTLIPLATVITPNLPEAAALLGLPSISEEDQELIAKTLLSLGSKAVLLKGGHLTAKHSNDFLINQNQKNQWFTSPRIESKNTHGTGCTLSAAIAACLAQGFDLETSCHYAKNYIFHAIAAAKDEKIGKGRGPVHHFYHLWPLLDSFLK